MLTKSRKMIFALLILAVFSLCAVMFAGSGAKVNADEFVSDKDVDVTVTFSTVKYNVKNDGAQTLLVAAVDVSDITRVYELGFKAYDGEEETTLTPTSDSYKTHYYTSVNGADAKTIFGNDYDGQKLVVWKIATPTENVSYAPYLKYGYHKLVEEEVVLWTYGSSKEDLIGEKKAVTVAEYTVKHLQQNLADDDYTEVEADRETKSGIVGAATLAAAKSYTGFGAGSFAQGTIAANGSTVVEVEYDRNTYTVTWYNDDGETVLETDSSVKYGATPSFDGATPTKADSYAYSYAFNEFTPAVATVTENTSYTAAYNSTLIPRTAFDFENSESIAYTTKNKDGCTYDLSLATYANEAVNAPSNGGLQGIKLTNTTAKDGKGYPVVEIALGQTITAGGLLAFDFACYDPNGASGHFGLIVNGVWYDLNNQGAYHWNLSGIWVHYLVPITSASSIIYLGAQVGSGTFASPSDISAVEFYFDNVQILDAKTSFDFESADDLKYVTMSGMTNMERVANDGTKAPVHDGSGDYILKGTPTDVNATFTFNFGKTLAAGTQLHFSIYVANEDDNVYGWFPLIVNGLNQGASYAYWTSGTQWSKDTWAEGPWTLQSDANSLSICCNFAGFFSNGGNALDISKLTVYIDNVMVVS